MLNVRIARCTEIADIISSSAQTELVLDVRTPNIFRDEHIGQAVNVYFSEPLEVSFLQSLPKLPESAVTAFIKTHFKLDQLGILPSVRSHLESFSRSTPVFVYDSDSIFPLDSPVAFPLIMALQNAGFDNVKFLEGGFSLFKFRHPEQVTRPPSPRLSQLAALPALDDAAFPSLTLRHLVLLLSPALLRHLPDIDTVTVTDLPNTVTDPGGPTLLCARRRLFCGSALHAHAYPLTEALGIRALVNVAHEVASAASPDRHCLKLSVRDEDAFPIADFFDAFETLLRQQLVLRRPTLVHCRLGCSRAPALLLVFLMRVCRLPLLHAYLWLKKRRPCIAPNLGFMLALLREDVRLFGRASIPAEVLHMAHVPRLVGATARAAGARTARAAARDDDETVSSSIAADDSDEMSMEQLLATVEVAQVEAQVAAGLAAAVEDEGKQSVVAQGETVGGEAVSDEEREDESEDDADGDASEVSDAEEVDDEEDVESDEDELGGDRDDDEWEDDDNDNEEESYLEGSARASYQLEAARAAVSVSQSARHQTLRVRALKPQQRRQNQQQRQQRQQRQQAAAYRAPVRDVVSLPKIVADFNVKLS